eukprot:297751-Prymnesium_polylepis.1
MPRRSLQSSRNTLKRSRSRTRAARGAFRAVWVAALALHDGVILVGVVDTLHVGRERHVDARLRS